MEATLDEMAGLRESFLETAAAFLRNWYEEETARQIRLRPDRTLKLEDVELKSLHQDVANLQAEVDEIIAEEIGQLSYWWDLEPREQIYVFWELSFPPALDDALQLAAGRLSPILEAHGFEHELRLFENHGSEKEELDEQLAAFLGFYPTRVFWPEKMKELLEQYEAMLLRAAGEQKELESLERQQAETEAGRVWDEAVTTPLPEKDPSP